MPNKSPAEIFLLAAVIALCALAVWLSLASPGFALDNKVVYQGF